MPKVAEFQIFLKRKEGNLNWQKNVSHHLFSRENLPNWFRNWDEFGNFSKFKLCNKIKIEHTDDRGFSPGPVFSTLVTAPMFIVQNFCVQKKINMQSALKEKFTYYTTLTTQTGLHLLENGTSPIVKKYKVKTCICTNMCKFVCITLSYHLVCRNICQCVCILREFKYYS